MAHGRTERVSANVRPAGGQRNQEVHATLCYLASRLYLTHPITLRVRSNAVNSSVTKRSKTQGAANQARARVGHASYCLSCLG